MKNIWQNIKTTLFGTIAGVPTIIEGAQTKNLAHIIVGIATLLLGLFAKDNTTGEL
jgi:branched-subunit amino acid transport protein